VDGPEFAYPDLKAFLARNAEGGAADAFPQVEIGPDLTSLLEAVRARADDMAQRALDIFSKATPETALWSAAEQERFISQSRRRFETILDVTGTNEGIDDDLVSDLEAVGAGAAWAESPLPQLLLVLRISRDVVVQTAVDVAEAWGRRWGLALSLLLNRVLPALDRLTDALAQGYWAAVVHREEDDRARYEHLVERSSDGIYELDTTGRVSYANSSLAAMVGVNPDAIEGSRLAEMFSVVGTPEVLDRLSLDEVEEADETFEIVRSDGVRRELHVVSFPRRAEGNLAGYQGVVRDVTAARETDRAKNEFLEMITHDLRAPITTILGLAVTLEAYGEELPPERSRRTGASIRRQAERISRLADDLYEVSRLESRSLRLSLRTVQVLDAVDAALASLRHPEAVEVEVPDTLQVLADARRLEQVIANLVENAVSHGGPPVRVVGAPVKGGVEMSVTDAGPGVPEAVVPSLFTRLGTERAPGDHFGAGVGLFLVRGLVEAMGGRVDYEPVPGGGACFRVRLLPPTR
jgi:PAS domain S-box-containing protein